MVGSVMAEAGIMFSGCVSQLSINLTKLHILWRPFFLLPSLIRVNEQKLSFIHLQIIKTFGIRIIFKNLSVPTYFKLQQYF